MGNREWGERDRSHSPFPIPHCPSPAVPRYTSTTTPHHRPPAREPTMPPETIFSKIIRREIPAAILHQDELVTAFRDIGAQAPTHVLIVPNELVPTVADVEPRHEAALGRMFTVARRIAEQEGIAEDGYRLI